MGNEKYFTLSSSQIKSNDNFYADMVQDTPDNIKFKRKQKIETCYNYAAIVQDAPDNIKFKSKLKI